MQLISLLFPMRMMCYKTGFIKKDNNKPILVNYNEILLYYKMSKFRLSETKHFLRWNSKKEISRKMEFDNNYGLQLNGG